jgi:hypothetical protein
MATLLRARLPPSTDFGNAKPSTTGLSLAQAGRIGAPPPGNADFIVIQTHLPMAAVVQSCFFEAQSLNRVLKNRWLVSLNFDFFR